MAQILKLKVNYSRERAHVTSEHLGNGGPAVTWIISL